MKNILKLTIKINLILFLSGLFLSGLTSCSSHDDYLDSAEIPDGEHEEPAKLVLNFQSTTSNLAKSYVYEVPEGTTEPVITQITNLPAGTYDVSVQMFAADGEDLTDEIFGHDKDEHFVYYSKVKNSNVNITYADDDVRDSNQVQIGKKTVWTLSQGESPQIVYLSHQPAVKNPNAVSIEQLGGEIDLEAHFNIKITN